MHVISISGEIESASEVEVGSRHELHGKYYDLCLVYVTFPSEFPVFNNLEKLAMKKSLIALAAVAAVGAASAQSSVTLYGRIDSGFAFQRAKASVTAVGGGTASNKETTTGFTSGITTSSRVGIKGQEDLGNGLAAVFNVEWNLDSISGSLATNAAARRSVVGLKGGFGQVLVGRDYTVVDNVIGDFTAIDMNAGNFYTGRTTGIHYSGSFSGVSVAAFAGYDSFKDVVTRTGVSSVTLTDNKSYSVGLGLGYENGPFAIGGAVQYFDAKAIGSRTRSTEYALGASYDFTSAKLFAHYVGRKPRGSKVDHQVGLGVEVPMGALTLSAQYTFNDFNGGVSNPWVTNNRLNSIVGTALNAGGVADAPAVGKGHDFALQAKYALSKRTSVYARAARFNSFKADGNSGLKGYQDLFGIGLRHDF